MITMMNFNLLYRKLLPADFPNRFTNAILTSFTAILKFFTASILKWFTAIISHVKCTDYLACYLKHFTAVSLKHFTVAILKHFTVAILKHFTAAILNCLDTIAYMSLKSAELVPVLKIFELATDLTFVKRSPVNSNQ